MVWHDHRHYRHDRRGHPSCGDQCLCRKKYHQDPVQRDLQRRLSLSDQPWGMCGAAVLFSATCDVAPEFTHEVETTAVLPGSGGWISSPAGRRSKRVEAMLSPPDS